MTLKAAIRKRGARVFAPVLTGVVLLGVLVIGGVDAAPIPGRASYFERISRAVADIPYAIGDWRGQNEEVIQAARRLLKPTALLQRRYVSPGEPPFGLLVVHCRDVRDMEGHYPPICYPAQGWTLVEQRSETLTVGDETAPMRRYVFQRQSDLATSRVVVWHAFLLPGDQPLVDNIAAVDQAGRSASRAGLGSGQIQVLVPEGAGAERRIVESCLQALAPTIRTIAEGTDHEQAP